MSDLLSELVTSDLATAAAQSKEGVLRVAVDSALGEGQWELRQLPGRATLAVLPNGNEIFSLDGRALVEFLDRNQHGGLQNAHHAEVPASDAQRPSSREAGVSEANAGLPVERVVRRRVVCAAIRAADGEVLLGIRHYSRDMHRQIEARTDGEKFCHRHDPDQGFVDQHGVYMTREEAYVVATAAGQVAYPEHCGRGLDGPKLYSEGLY